MPFVNNWPDYGGIPAYMAAFSLSSKAEWYTSLAAQTQYRAYVQFLVDRYKASPAVFAWELANEPRCAGCSTDVIYNWARDTSAFIKGLDASHMVALGDEGFGVGGGSGYPYSDYEGVDFERNLGIATLDFGTVHLYPSSCEFFAAGLRACFNSRVRRTDGVCVCAGGISDAEGNDWIEAHAAACLAAGKPCLLEECKPRSTSDVSFGAGTDFVDGTEADKCTVMTQWQETAEMAAGMGGDAFWQYVSLGLRVGAFVNEWVQGDASSWHDDGHTVYWGSGEYQCLVLDRDV